MIPNLLFVRYARSFISPFDRPNRKTTANYYGNYRPEDENCAAVVHLFCSTVAKTGILPIEYIPLSESVRPHRTVLIMG